VPVFSKATSLENKPETRDVQEKEDIEDRWREKRRKPLKKEAPEYQNRVPLEYMSHDGFESVEIGFTAYENTFRPSGSKRITAFIMTLTAN
jgi:hypothetical protein